MDTYRQNFATALHQDFVRLVEKRLTPLADRLGYGEGVLHQQISWKPVVLLIGNYSSGKSTLINEMLGQTVQETGQAPTDDGFTVITGPESDDRTGEGRAAASVASGSVTAEPDGPPGQRDGASVMADPGMPFGRLRRHGSKLAAHFRMKTVSAPMLRNMVLIDTPGMLDSVAEKGRGYDYQQVIGDLAAIADLVLVLFDPHKAGTVAETYASLRETLPRSTMEDRVCFVLNRVDECDTLSDLLRVYGTLCWNLSQMLGRKDIPRIYLTWTPGLKAGPAPAFLAGLHSEKDALRQAVERTPGMRFDHLASFAEEHGERLRVVVRGLLAWSGLQRRQTLRMLTAGVLAGLIVGLLAGLYTFALPVTSDLLPVVAVGAAVLLLVLAFVMLVIAPWRRSVLKTEVLADPARLFTLSTARQQEVFAQVSELLLARLRQPRSGFSRRELRGLDAMLTDVIESQTAVLRAAARNGPG